MNTKIKTLLASFVVASVALLGAMGSAQAKDDWFVLSEQSISASDPSASITSEGGRWDKDVKKVKISVEGADVEITNLVLKWDNRPDDTITDVGVLKAGGQTAEKNAPGLKGRLKGVQLQYKIVGANSATVKVWGFD